MKNIPVLLVRAEGRDNGDKVLPFGLLSMAAYLGARGVEVAVIDRNKRRQPISQLVSNIKKMAPKVVGISALSSQARDALLLGRALKKCLPSRIVYGGQHFTAFPQEGLEAGDAVVRNDGETAFLRICSMDAENIGGVYEGEPLSSLDEIALPPDGMLKELHDRGDDFVLMTSRGCYFNCIFCKKRDHDNKVRYHSMDYAFGYMEKMKRLFGIRTCFIADDIFTVDKSRVMQFCEEARRRDVGLEFTCFTHANINDMEMYRAMKGAGFREVQIGVESGNDGILKLLNKKQTAEDCVRTIEAVKEAGLSPVPLFMIGNIGETRETIEDTIRLAVRLRKTCDYGWVSYAQPFPGTTFYDVAAAYGKLVNDDPTTYWNTRLTFVPAGLSARETERLFAVLRKVLQQTKAPFIERVKRKLRAFNRV